MSISIAHNQFQPGRGVTRRIWDIADTLTSQSGRKAKRSEVLSAAEAEGLKTNTASTQYDAWQKSYDAWQEQQGLDEAPANLGFIRLEMAPDGRILIPIEVRRAMLMGDDRQLTAELVDGELRLCSPAVALKRLQKMFEPFRGGPSVVDELIAERRAEAERE